MNFEGNIFFIRVDLRRFIQVQLRRLAEFVVGRSVGSHGVGRRKAANIGLFVEGESQEEKVQPHRNPSVQTSDGEINWVAADQRTELGHDRLHLSPIFVIWLLT